MRLIDRLNLLDHRDWSEHVSIIEDKVKAELQGSGGFIRAIKIDTESDRKLSCQRALDAFYNSGVEQLDERMNVFLSEIEEINNRAKFELQYDFIRIFMGYEDLHSHPNLSVVQSFLKTSGTNQLKFSRMSAILNKIANQSLSQANKSNAGQAGESLVRAALSSVGLVSGVHYREQYKSKSGSNTDFAFPLIEDYNDSQLEVLVAAQISTNDRARLTTSELKQGVVGYVVTGNGLKASSKCLHDIGNQIIASYEKENIRIVCYEKEILRERDLLKNLLSTNPNKKEIEVRLRYFTTHTLSFEEFATKMRRFAYA